MASKKTEHLTMAEVIALAKKKGINFTYRKRKDGSYRVMTLEGVKFKSDSSKGNAALRKMVGASLSRRRSKQLKEARPKLPKGVQKVLNRAKRGKFGKGKPKVGFTEARKSVKEIGEKATIKNIEQTLKESEELVDPNRLDALLAVLEARLYMAEAWGAVDIETILKAQGIFQQARNRGVRKPPGNSDIVDVTGYYDLLEMLDQAIKVARQRARRKKNPDPGMVNRASREVERFLRELKRFFATKKRKKKK